MGLSSLTLQHPPPLLAVPKSASQRERVTAGPQDCHTALDSGRAVADTGLSGFQPPEPGAGLHTPLTVLAALSPIRHARSWPPALNASVHCAGPTLTASRIQVGPHTPGKVGCSAHTQPPVPAWAPPCKPLGTLCLGLRPGHAAQGGRGGAGMAPCFSMSFHLEHCLARGKCGIK